MFFEMGLNAIGGMHKKRGTHRIQNVINITMEIIQFSGMAEIESHNVVYTLKHCNGILNQMCCSLYHYNQYNIWRPPSLNELTQMIYNMGLTH